MKKSIASVLRKIADMIVVDNTPTDEDICRMRSMKIRRDEGDTGDPAAPRLRALPDEDGPLPQPEIRAPRRQHEHQKKWNQDTKKGLMKGYMQDYRAEGKDVGNRYVKKPKV